MEYLYRALKREVGVAENELSTASLQEEHRSEPIASVAETSMGDCVPVGHYKSVPFPANTDRLFALRTKDTDKEHIHALEQYRVLRSRVLEIMRMQKMRTLMVTSAVSGEFKTITAINLALALSKVQGIKVLLVDADLRKPGIAEVLGVPYHVGLHDYLRTPMQLTDMLLQLTDSLFFAPSGGVDQNSAELLHSSEMLQFVSEVHNQFDIVVFDAPPLFPIADARVLANLVDSVLFCVRAGRTSETTVSEAIELVRPKLMGTVLAGAKPRPGGSHYYYYESHGKE